MALEQDRTIIAGPPAFPPQLAGRRSPAKVPGRITAHFWVIKVLSTAMGEAASDFLAHSMNPFLAGLVGFLAFAVAMWLQLSARRYQAGRYWLAVAMVAIFGTMAADGPHYQFGIPFVVSAVFYLVLLAGVLIAWYRSEGTLSIHSITTRRRELFYWATVLSTFALGTALGDLTAFSFGWGFLTSAMVFLILFALPGAAYRLSAVGPVAGFWAAYILTRPLGASFADWFDMPRSLGGLGVSRLVVALVLAAPIVILVRHLARTRLDVVRSGSPAVRRPPPAPARPPRPAGPAARR